MHQSQSGFKNYYPTLSFGETIKLLLILKNYRSTFQYGQQNSNELISAKLYSQHQHQLILTPQLKSTKGQSIIS